MSQIRMDCAKVTAIRERHAPTKVTEFRSFLGLANYYKRFIKGYSKIACPLKDLLKKERKWEWDAKCQAAFQKLKDAITSKPILRLPDFGVAIQSSHGSIGQGPRWCVSARGASDSIRESEVRCSRGEVQHP